MFHELRNTPKSRVKVNTQWRMIFKLSLSSWLLNIRSWGFWCNSLFVLLRRADFSAFNRGIKHDLSLVVRKPVFGVSDQV